MEWEMQADTVGIPLQKLTSPCWWLAATASPTKKNSTSKLTSLEHFPFSTVCRFLRHQLVRWFQKCFSTWRNLRSWRSSKWSTNGCWRWSKAMAVKNSSFSLKRQWRSIKCSSTTRTTKTLFFKRNQIIWRHRERFPISSVSDRWTWIFSKCCLDSFSTYSSAPRF